MRKKIVLRLIGITLLLVLALLLSSCGMQQTTYLTVTIELTDVVRWSYAQEDFFAFERNHAFTGVGAGVVFLWNAANDNQ